MDSIRRWVCYVILGLVASSYSSAGEETPTSIFEEVPIWKSTKPGHYNTHWGFGYASTEWLPEYIKALKSDKKQVVDLSLRCLYSLNRDAKPALPGVLELLNHRSRDIKVKALKCCGQMGVADSNTLGKIRPWLECDDKVIRLAAINAHFKLESPRIEYYRQVKQLLHHPNQEVQNEANETLGVAQSELIPFFVQEVFSKNPADRHMGLNCLVRTRSTLDRAIALFVSGISLLDSHPAVRAKAVECLASNSLVSHWEMMALSIVLRYDRSSTVRSVAIDHVLHYERELPREVCREVAHALTDKSDEVRRSAGRISELIFRYECPLPQYLPSYLSPLLIDKRSSVRQEALNLMGTCRSNTAIPSILSSILLERDPEIKLTGLIALALSISNRE
jgi:hypothetical protein